MHRKIRIIFMIAGFFIMSLAGGFLAQRFTEPENASAQQCVDLWQSGMFCGISWNNCGGSGGGSTPVTMVPCQGFNPLTSCPANFTRRTIAVDRRQSTRTGCYYTCMRN